MAVKVGSARIDENGKAYGGAAGDQTGNEVSTQNWYLHKKGWRVFRAKDPAAAEKIAVCMERACKNDKIGYDQYQRNTLYTQAAKVGFDVSKVTTACETDCSALVRVCCAYAGIMGLPSDFRTGNMPANLLGTKRFTELTDVKYTTKSNYLRRGDILVTKTSGHTVVVLSDGSKAEKTEAPAATTDLKRGAKSAAVEALQRGLLVWKNDCLPKWGADGDFGKETEDALKAFQMASRLPTTGVYDSATEQALKAVGGPRTVVATGDVNVRTAPSLSSRILGVLKKGKSVMYQDEQKDGWYLVVYKDQNAWVSSKYARVEG